LCLLLVELLPPLLLLGSCSARVSLEDSFSMFLSRPRYGVPSPLCYRLFGASAVKVFCIVPLLFDCVSFWKGLRWPNFVRVYPPPVPVFTFRFLQRLTAPPVPVSLRSLVLLFQMITPRKDLSQTSSPSPRLILNPDSLRSPHCVLENPAPRHPNLLLSSFDKNLGVCCCREWLTCCVFLGDSLYLITPPQNQTPLVDPRSKNPVFLFVSPRSMGPSSFLPVFLNSLDFFDFFPSLSPPPLPFSHAQCFPPFPVDPPEH